MKGHQTVNKKPYVIIKFSSKGKYMDQYKNQYYDNFGLQTYVLFFYRI